MSNVLRTDVHVQTPDGVVVLPKGATVPKELREFVTNPKAYVEVGDEPAGAEGDESYGSLSATKLKALLKKRELPQVGEKDELIARLVADDAEHEVGDEPAGAEGDDQSPDDEDE